MSFDLVIKNGIIVDDPGNSGLLLEMARSR